MLTNKKFKEFVKRPRTDSLDIYEVHEALCVAERKLQSVCGCLYVGHRDDGRFEHWRHNAWKLALALNTLIEMDLRLLNEGVYNNPHVYGSVVYDIRQAVRAITRLALMASHHFPYAFATLSF